MGRSDEDWRARVDALIQAMRDVRGEGATAQYGGTVGGPHAALFERYVRDLRRAKGGADKRWDAMVAAEFGRTGDLTLAERNVAKRNPIGRASAPGVIAVVRKYWLECDALNSLVPTLQRILPEEFLLRLTSVEPHEELAKFISALPYWPIGMDAEGRWV